MACDVVETHQEPSHFEAGSLTSSQIPENSTPALDQFDKASVQYVRVFLENQSGNTWCLQSGEHRDLIQYRDFKANDAQCT